MDRRANKPTKHGADHLPGGQDPITGLGDGLRYDTDNEGDWFFGRANVGEVNRDGDGTTVVSWEFSTGSSNAPGLLDGDGGWIIDTAGTVTVNGLPITLSNLVVTPGSTLVDAPFTVNDSGNNPVFEVRDDGTVHIKTGTSVIADL